MAGSGTAALRDEDVVLRVEHLTVEFPLGRDRRVHAVSDVSLDVVRGETLGLVGESGCGKSTIARAVMQLPPPTSGSVLFSGEDLTRLRGERLRRTRTQLQMIFQDPVSSLNPRRKVRDIVAEGLSIWGERHASFDHLVDQVLHAVGLDPEAVGGRRPHEFSGGQCQRICLARSLVLDPQMLICDEPVSALDVSVQAQILNLLEDMKARYGLTMIFISHDLAVVKNISDRLGVMYLGKLCEMASADAIYQHPAHPYTAALLASIPKPDPTRVSRGVPLAGELPSPVAPPSGCRFRTRCPKARDRCAAEEPVMRMIRQDQFVACHFPLEQPAGDGLVDLPSPVAAATVQESKKEG